MAKKTYFTGLIFCLFSITSFSQGDRDKDFVEKLNSLYKRTVPFIYAEELASETGNRSLILIDARSREEYETSHISGAKFVDYDSFKASDVQGLGKNADIVVYCAVGYRSERIGEDLLKMGFTNVRNLYGGIFDWVNQGNIVVNLSGSKTDSVHTYNKDWSRWLRRGVKVY
jgi:rhodanese-related sulfurtransferase